MIIMKDYPRGKVDGYRKALRDVERWIEEFDSYPFLLSAYLKDKIKEKTFENET
jgi:hypothetical protein